MAPVRTAVAGILYNGLKAHYERIADDLRNGTCPVCRVPDSLAPKNESLPRERGTAVCLTCKERAASGTLTRAEIATLHDAKRALKKITPHARRRCSVAYS